MSDPTIPGVTLSLYADDAMFLCRSARPERATVVMQQKMDLLEPWLEKWRIQVNPDKNTAVCFRKRRRMPRATPPPMALDDELITWKQQVKYLGVTLDSKLNFGPNARGKAAEARRIAASIGPLINRRSTLPMMVITTLFLFIVRALIMYASTAWWATCSLTNRRNLETIQSKALRSISKQPWFIRNQTIRLSLQVPSLDEFARASGAKFF